MRIAKLFFNSLFLFLFFLSSAYAGTENLDERLSRKSRFPGSWGAAILEDDTTYIWQPETLCFINDLGKEVWLFAQTPGGEDYIYDITFGQVSADGKRYSFLSSRTTAAQAKSYDTWMTSKIDGTYLRPLHDSEEPQNVHDRLKHWSPSEPDTYYGFGSITLSVGTAKDQLYKVTVDDESSSYVSIIDFNNDTEMMLLKTISADGLKAVALDFSETTAWPLTLGLSPTNDVVNGYPIKRDMIDTYWGEADWDDFRGFHDQFFSGLVNGDAPIKLMWMPSTTGGTLDGHWYASDLTGTYADGGPDHTADRTYPYSWGEIDIISTKYGGGTDPWTKAKLESEPVDDTGYPSHPAFDPWGEYMFFAGNNGASPYAGGAHIAKIYDGSTKTNVGFQSFTYLTSHAHWTFSNKLCASSTMGDGDWVINFDYNSNNQTKLAPYYRAYNGGTPDYEALARPTQSPDGTKIFYHSTLLNSIDDNGADIYWVVSVYPHPPEISAVSATSGTVNISAWWNLGTTPRGYTDRGFPSVSTDDPLPPREISLFRLWRSTDGSTWTPIKTFVHDIWDKYDFADGTWGTGTEADNKWSTTDTPGDGTWYYGVTSIENSKLESQTISNVFSITVSSGSGAGSQSSAYPADPGGGSGVISTYNADLHRYYNIYAEDGSTPTINQVNRIASDPRTAKSFIDVFGNSDDSTLYTVTAVDSQGNESAALSVTRQIDTPASGIYTITWTDGEEEPDPEPTSVSIPSGSISGGRFQ